MLKRIIKRLFNATRDGVEQIFDNLIFQGEDGIALEMRPSFGGRPASGTGKAWFHV
jgi:hypothetical protein